jgi:hypothetical protein
MNKKGISDIVLLIADIGAVVLVGFLIMTASLKLSDTTTVSKINLAEDIRIMVNTLIGVPGEAIVKYPTNITGLSIISQDTGILVFVPGEIKEKQVVRNYYLPKGYSVEGVISDEDTFCLEKKEKKIILMSCPEELASFTGGTY